MTPTVPDQLLGILLGLSAGHNRALWLAMARYEALQVSAGSGCQKRVQLICFLLNFGTSIVSMYVFKVSTARSRRGGKFMDDEGFDCCNAEA